MSASASPSLVLGWASQRLQLAANATISSTLTIVVPNSIVVGTYTVNVTATGNGIVHTAIIKIQVVAPPIVAPPDFTITVAPTQMTIQSGHSSTVTVTLNGLYKFNGTINLTTLTGNGAILSLNTQTLVLSYVTSSATTTLTIALPADAAPGSTYTITLSATNGTTTRQASIVVTAMTSSGGQPTSSGIGGLSTPNAIALGLLVAGIVTLAVFFIMKRRESQKTTGTNKEPMA
jgi:uncharacterized membrane protein